MSSRSGLSPVGRVRDRLAAARRALLRRRRLLAVLLTAASVGAGVHAAAPPPPPTVEVLVAARDLPAGVALAGSDLATATLPPDAVPDGTVTDPEGRLLAAPLRRGEPLTDARLVGPDLVDAAAGSVAVPVRLSDADQASLLTVGDRIDLLATDPEDGTTSVVAAGALVLAVPEDPGTTGDALTGRVVVVQIYPDTVSQVAGAAATSIVTYAWSGR